MSLRRGDATDFCGDSSTKRNKVIEVGNFSLWSELPDGLLELILKRVGVTEFFIFASVCKSWRSVAIAFKQKFMASQAPLVFLKSTKAKKYCYFFNIFDKRLYRAAVPHLEGRKCLGFTCGYLVLADSKCRRKKPYIWLVNPFTRHELQFPRPQRYSNVILVSLANSDSDFVAVAFSRWFPFKVQFCRFGDDNWTVLKYRNNPSGILDVAVFKGKIYVLFSDGHIGTLNLNPPSVTSLHVRSVYVSNSDNLHLVASNEKLYVAEFRPAEGITKFYKLDFERMELENVSLKDEVFFFDDIMKCCGLSFIPQSWEHFDEQLNRVFYLGGGYVPEDRTALYFADRSVKCVPAALDVGKPNTFLSPPLWYFPHLSSNVDSVYDD